MVITSKIIYRSLGLLTLLFSYISCEKEHYFPEIAKVALRDVGHQLLLSNTDTTSVIKPVIALAKNKYQLQFNDDLAIHPDSLVSNLKNSFEKANLPSYYLVEVLQCLDNKVAYSYEMRQSIEKGIVPCAGRQLKKGCYTITVRFTTLAITQNKTSAVAYMILLGGLLLLAYLLYKKKSILRSEVFDTNFATLGQFKFYPEQNKLIKEATEIYLSKKECEILHILVSQPNKIIKREELTKKIWEDNGVVVGRSLDTYISKLRKKLQEDPSVKLINIHGVGYKLEIKI